MDADLLTIAARVGIAAVLVVAGFTKLRDGFNWIRQAADMGVAPRVASLVPWVEIALGAGVAVGWPSPWIYVATIALFVAFTVVIVARIADGTRPPCGCFGARSERNLGWRDVLRNLALIALASVPVF